MIRVKTNKFSKNNVITQYDFGFTKILTGSFFNDNSIIRKYRNHKDPEFLLKSNNNQLDSKPKDKFQIFKIEEINLISKISEHTEYIIITNLSEILCYPFMIKNFQINFNKIKFLTTPPIAQIAKYYLKDFYSILNKILIESEKSFTDIAFNEDKDQQLSLIIDSSDIDNFIDNMTSINHGEIFNTNYPHLCIKLISSGYDLGSSNILIKFFNKAIGIMTLSSNFNYRYPQLFDTRIFSQSDSLILLPDVINYSSDYESQIVKLTTEIYKITSKLDLNSEYYPAIFMPTNPLFLLDFVDFMRYKVPKEVKHIYISKSIKAILEYANISHGFMNSFIHNKIFEFKLPFNFDELIKNNSLYLFNDFEELLNSASIVKIKNTPTIFMVDNFSFCFQFGESFTVFENFLHNSSLSDALILLDKNLDKNFKSDLPLVKNRNLFNLDLRISFEQFKKLFYENININENNLKNFFFSKYDLNLIEFEKFSLTIPNQVNKYDYDYESEFVIDFSNDNLIYDKSYLVTSSCKEYEKITQNQFTNFLISAEKQNENFFLKLTPDYEYEKTERSNFERLEHDMNRIIKANNMIINEFLCKENSIHISIVKHSKSEELKEENSFSDVVIVVNDKKSQKDTNCDFDISVTSENFEDSQYLNNVIQILFY